MGRLEKEKNRKLQVRRQETATNERRPRYPTRSHGSREFAASGGTSARTRVRAGRAARENMRTDPRAK